MRIVAWVTGIFAMVLGICNAFILVPSQTMLQERSNEAVRRTLDALRQASRQRENLIPLILDAVKAEATLGEICDAWRSVWGTWRETPVF